MEKWEYCAVQEDEAPISNTYGGIFTEFKERFPKPVPLPIGLIPVKIAMLGREGWEMVSYTSVPGPTGRLNVWMFKRPME